MRYEGRPGFKRIYRKCGKKRSKPWRAKQYNIRNDYVYAGDFVQISDAMNGIMEELKSTIGEISRDVEVVRGAGVQVEKLAAVLAENTGENAKTVERMTEALGTVVGHVGGTLEKMQEVDRAERRLRTGRRIAVSGRKTCSRSWSMSLLPRGIWRH